MTGTTARAPGLAVHGACLRGSDLLADIEIARRAGFSGIELWVGKLEEFLRTEPDIAVLYEALSGMAVPMIDVLMPIERSDQGFRAELAARCERLSAAAAGVSAPAIQVVALDEFESGDSAAARVRQVVGSLIELVELAEPHKVRLGLEPVCFSRLRRLEEAMEVIEALGPGRVGLVLDTFHMWASGWSLDAVAAIPPAYVVCAQLSDASQSRGTGWSDSDRAVLPGDGVIPLDEIIGAIQSSGFVGPWTAEVHGLDCSSGGPDSLLAQIRGRAADLLS
jgi:sugar phosphate isomerase/epimerase